MQRCINRDPFRVSRPLRVFRLRYFLHFSILLLLYSFFKFCQDILSTVNFGLYAGLRGIYPFLSTAFNYSKEPTRIPIEKSTKEKQELHRYMEQKREKNISRPKEIRLR